MKTALLTTAAILMLATTSQAKTVSCTVTTVQNEMVTLDCTGTTTGFKIGQKVSVKGKKSRKKAIEGC